MKLHLSFALILSLALLETPCIAKPKKIKILSWWEFLAPAASNILKKKGFDFEITEYRSNEVALAKLLNNKSDYDVIVVSNWVREILIKSDKIETNILKNVGRKRNYLHFIQNFDGDFNCLPYLWAISAYAIDTTGLGIKKIDLFKMAQLKKNGYKIEIIDDPIEFGALALLSNDKSCLKNLSPDKFFEGITKCNFPSSQEISKLFKPTDFRNSVRSVLGKNTALYGWHGELGEVIEKYDYMDFIEPDHPSVIGLDSVCIVKKKAIRHEVVEFAKELTSEKITKINANKMQYFSSYRNLFINYNPKIRKIYDKTLKKLEYEKPIVLYPPANEIQQELNIWWQKIRYEKR